MSTLQCAWVLSNVNKRHGRGRAIEKGRNAGRATRRLRLWAAGHGFNGLFRAITAAADFLRPLPPCEWSEEWLEATPSERVRDGDDTAGRLRAGDEHRREFGLAVRRNDDRVEEPRPLLPSLWERGASPRPAARSQSHS